MTPKKKLFESDDFDKKKKLFTSSDFDKESEEKTLVGHQTDGENGAKEVSNGNEKSNSKYWIWIVLVFVGVCIIGYFIFFKSRDTTVKESEQETEIAEETIVTSDSVANQEAIEKVLTTDENEVSNNADNQEIRIKEAPASTDTNLNNAIPTTTRTANISSDVEVEAMKVIRGDYGVGQERKKKLGTQYGPIQNRVNQLKREGVF